MNDKQNRLDKLKKTMAEDNLPLKEGATNLVFGEGNPDANIVFIGEGPGRWEDIKARPFVGNAGAFLNQLLVSVKIPRETVYITNVVHYRPPANRDPEPGELKAFSVYLDEMIKIINPKLIVTLGRFSMGKFLPGVMISRVHGKVHKLYWKGMDLVVIPMYHPAAGLRNGEIKRRTVEDFKTILSLFKEINEGQIEKKQKEQKQAEQMSLV